MAGHSKFKNIMHRKGAQDKLRAKLFSKLGREISVAVRSGGEDITSNIRLRSAISAAKSVNMPKDNIERAIKKGKGNDPDSNYQEVRYEGFGPQGTAIIVEALTNNKNRTASEIRSTFSKNGGTLAETGSVSYNFEKVGSIILKRSIASEEEIFEFVIENGSTDIETNEDNYSIYCEVKDFQNLIEKISKKFALPTSNQIIWRAKKGINLELESAKKMLNLVNALEDNDDVQKVSSNIELTDSVLNELVGLN